MQFEHQLQSARMAADIINEKVGISRQQWRGLVAEAYRIASRKALSNRQMEPARHLLAEALRLCPWLFARDLRAAGTFLLVTSGWILPARIHSFVYGSVRALMRVFFRHFIAGSKKMTFR